MCQSITQQFVLYTIKIVYCQGDMFQPSLGHLQPLWETDPGTIYISLHCRIPNAYRLYYRNVKYMSLYTLGSI